MAPEEQDPEGLAAARPLLTDLYQVTMALGYWKAGRAREPAVFELFFRSSPFGGAFVLAAGLRDCVRFLQAFRLRDAGALGGLGQRAAGFPGPPRVLSLDSTPRRAVPGLGAPPGHGPRFLRASPHRRLLRGDRACTPRGLDRLPGREWQWRARRVLGRAYRSCLAPTGTE